MRREELLQASCCPTHLFTDDDDDATVKRMWEWKMCNKGDGEGEEKSRLEYVRVVRNCTWNIMLYNPDSLLMHVPYKRTHSVSAANELAIIIIIHLNSVAILCFRLLTFLLNLIHYIWKATSAMPCHIVERPKVVWDTSCEALFHKSWSCSGIHTLQSLTCLIQFNSRVNRRVIANQLGHVIRV